MLKTYDQGCLSCAWEGEIWTHPHTHPLCPCCGGPTERRWKTLGVIGDEIPGGQWIENLGHEPVKVYSKSQLRDEAKARGLVQAVRHMPVPGSDKSPVTTRWIGSPTDPLPAHYRDKALDIHASTSERLPGDG